MKCNVICFCFYFIICFFCAVCFIQIYKVVFINLIKCLLNIIHQHCITSYCSVLFLPVNRSMHFNQIKHWNFCLFMKLHT